MKITSGIHLKIIRTWILWNCSNGSEVAFNSNDTVQIIKQVTVNDLEELAQNIRDSVIDNLINRAALNGTIKSFLEKVRKEP